MAVWNWLGGKKRSPVRRFTRTITPLFDKLEPRILLSADSLLSAAVPEPLQENTQPLVTQTELLNSSKQQTQLKELSRKLIHLTRLRWW